MKRLTREPRTLKSVLPAVTAIKPGNRSSSIVNLSALADSGYYFCSGCQHVTQRVQRGVNFVCVGCGSHRVKYHPPIFV